MLSLAISNASLYSPDHEMVERSIANVLAAFGEMPEGKIEVMVVDDDLVVNKVRLKDGDLHGTSLVRRLKRRGVSWVEFTRGVTAGEMKGFVADIVERGRAGRAYPHIGIGVVGVRRAPAVESGLDDSIPEERDERRIDRLKEIYSGVSSFGRLEVKGLEEIVAAFVVAIRKEANVLRMISPVKAYSEYTYTHATNVALLSILQAEALGIGDGLLHEIGVAALMHDVGKLFISIDVLNKKGKLEKEEFEEMMRHPVYGAHYLAGTKGLTRLAPMAAFEHHRKFDCTGYPRLKAGEKGQHVCSQIVAIADFFDALRSNRPYRAGWEAERILSLMREDAGRAFSPRLLANFEALLREALEKEESPADRGPPGGGVSLT
jgi:HD-GYP domain-containing protein (c-di-GMP phosphodiesterase class II)